MRICYNDVRVVSKVKGKDSILVIFGNVFHDVVKMSLALQLKNVSNERERKWTWRVVFAVVVEVKYVVHYY